MLYRILFFLTTFTSFNSIVGQVFVEKNTHVKGTIWDNRQTDTIVFGNGQIEAKFYERTTILSEVKKGKFSIDATISYPQLYTMSFESERGRIASWGGDYFIDDSTSSIVVDSVVGCSELNGKTFVEYRNNFLPFFLGADVTCKLSTLELIKLKDADFDKKLLQYTSNNPSSFVALWALINAVNSDGYSVLYETILNSFSQDMKKGKLWKLLKEDLASIRIKENEKFPVLDLKNLQLVDVKLKLPKSKYILIDYWFNNCRPCIEKFPKMKELYDTYKSKGFEIIGISVDRTKSIFKWQESIRVHELTWINYLDENGSEASKDKIYTFPTTYLLNDKGQIIKKNIELEELEEILKSKL